MLQAVNWSLPEPRDSSNVSKFQPFTKCTQTEGEITAVHFQALGGHSSEV